MNKLNFWFWILNSRPWVCYWIIHSIALLGESVDDDLENNAIDFLGRCQVRLLKFFLRQSWKPFCFFFSFFIWYLVGVHVLLVQGSDGGYGGGPGQVSICLFLENVWITVISWKFEFEKETGSFYSDRSRWYCLRFDTSSYCLVVNLPNMEEIVRMYNF